MNIMAWFRGISIRGKLITIALAASIVGLLAAGAALVTIRHYRAEQLLVQDITSIGKLLADRSTAALAFSDARMAEENLRSLRDKIDVVSAVIYAEDGTIFARYQQEGIAISSFPPAEEARTHRFDQDHLLVFEPIVLDGQRIGTVFIMASLTAIEVRFYQYALIVLAVITLATLAAYLTSRLLQGFISEPILKLTEAARKITDERNYSLRVEKNSEDEVGHLVETFNSMLKMIEAQESKLLNVNRDLEKRIELRTTELTQANQALEARDRERNTILERLNASENTLKRAQSIAHVGSWEWDIENGDLSWSDEIYHIFDRDQQQFNATYATFMECIHPDDREKVQQAIELAVSGSKDYNIEHRVVRPSGEERIVSEQGEIERDKDDKPVRMVGVVHDITARKEAEENLRAAKEAAEAATQAKSEFLSSMSHELRTPLNAILGFGQLLESDTTHPLTERQKEQIQHILKGGQHLLKLINEVLDLAKIEAGKLELSVETVNTRDLINDCLSFAKTLAAKRRITIDDRSHESLPVLWADHLRSKQAILNLLSNAVKYNREDGMVWLSTERLNEDILRISVSDTGQGIPKDKQEALFQPFSRLGAEATDIEGTGIGLVYTKKLIEEMNGKTGFESAPGEGSTFWIELPIAKQNIANERLPQVEEASEGDLKLGSEERLLLYVEDNPANLALMEDIVEYIPNLNLISTHTAELGLALAEERKPDIIILDINLPGMDGFAAIKELKKSDNTKQIPVLALSANAMPAAIRRGREAGFSDYLTKPVNIAELIAALRDALGETV